MPSDSATTGGSIDPAEIERFNRLAGTWWDPGGPMRPLHRFNPARIAAIRDRAAALFGRDIRTSKPFADLTLVDIGCGGGLVAEPMAKLGFAVTGLDAAENNIGVARAHAARSGLDIDYRVGDPEALALPGATFDVVLNLEVVEHVPDPRRFLAATVALIKPGGLMVVSTLSRTAKAFALAIVGVEYVLRWLPRGTHDWRKFLRPAELAAMIERTGARVTEFAGMSYSPFSDSWSETRDLDVNYMAFVHKERSAPGA